MVKSLLAVVKPAVVRSILALTAIASLAVAVGACGSSATSSDGSSASVPRASASVTGATAPPSARTPTTPAPSTATTPPSAPARSTPAPSAPAASSNPTIPPPPSPVIHHYTQRTGGVESVTKYGHPAAPSDEAAVRTAVRSYYAALGAGDYSVACSRLRARLLASMTQSFGHARGLVVCERALMAFYGRRPGLGFSRALTVTGVRVKGDQAFALVSTKAIPSGVFDMQLEHGSWRVGAISPFPLTPPGPPPS